MATTGSQDQHIQCQGWDSRVTGPAKVLPALARTPAHLWNDQQHPGEVLAAHLPFTHHQPRHLITATHGPKAPLPLKQLTLSTWSSPCHAGTPSALTSGSATAEPEPWECRKQPGGHQNLLGTGRTHILPGDRVGQGANSSSPAGTRTGTTLWDRARQSWLPEPPQPHRAQVPSVLGTAEL